MDSFTRFSDPYPFGSSCFMSSPVDEQETSCTSDASSTPLLGAHSEEEVLLATRCPKRRAGRRKFKETRHPIFRGVRRRNNNKWVCELREPNKKSRIWLGTYPTPEMAARAHDVAALAFRGKSACLNFADSSWRLPVPVSRDAGDIRSAASEAAELFRPPEFGGGGHDEVIGQNSGTLSSVEGSGEVCSKNGFQENMEYVDEEALFDMSGLLADMAQGLLLSPPNYAGNEIESSFWENEADLSLWNYEM